MKDNYPILSTHWGLMRYLEEEMNRVCGVPKTLLSNDSTEKTKIIVIGDGDVGSAIRSLNHTEGSVLIVDKAPDPETPIYEMDMQPIVEPYYDLPTKKELHKSKMEKIRNRRRK